MTASSSPFDTPRAWSVAVAAAVASGAVFGTAYTFGAFFDAMVEELDAGRGSTALVFGVTLLLFFGLGVVSGPLADRIGPRVLVLTAAVLIPIGLIMTSRVSSVAIGYLTYGVGVGVGGGLVAAPMYSTAGGWFVRRRALALGVVATGNGLGTLVLVPVAERLIAAHGWRTAYVLLGVTVAGLLVAAGVVIARAPVPPAPPALARMREVARDPAFRALFVVGGLFSVSLFVAFAFVVNFATAAGVDRRRAALLVGLIGASSVVGRLGISGLSGRVPAVRLLQGCLAAQPVAFFLWLVAGGSYPLLLAFAVLMGVAYGGFVALGPEVAAVLFGISGLGGVIGLMFLAAGLGGLVGPPLAGWLADVTAGRTVPIAVTLGVSLLAAALAFRVPVSAPTPMR